MWREFIKVYGINIWLDFHVSIQARVSLSVVNATNITSVTGNCHRNVQVSILLNKWLALTMRRATNPWFSPALHACRCCSLKQSATIKSIFKAPNAILVNGEHVTDPVKIADAFNEYFTSINATTALPDHQNLATLQSELDTLLKDFVNSHIQPSLQDKFCIPFITIKLWKHI